MLAIDVEHLSKSFDSQVAVKDISLKIREGEIFGFLGPNGSGKTTTIRMLCGLLTPDKGQGYCLGYDILTQSREIKAEVGYMPQNFSLYDDLTVSENLDFIARVYNIPHRQRAIAEIIDTMNFKDRKNQLAGSLSGGWKQHLSLAAALLHQPKLLLLDEPTAGVDPEARRNFWDLIHRLSRKNITSLVSTHYMDEAERCTRLAYIVQGELLVQGKVTQIIEQSDLYTFEVRGDDLQHLAEELEKTPGIEQVVAFGEILHISGRDKNILEKAFSPYRNRYQFSLSKPNLEDIFISLVRDNRDLNYG